MSASELPSFFIPGVPPEQQEERYTRLAEACRRQPLPLAERIYSIEFTSNGETWYATVGRQLSGSVTRVRRVRGKRTERFERLSNSSTVLAIFPDVPFLVFHDGASREWHNPFLAGRPLSIRQFAP